MKIGLDKHQRFSFLKSADLSPIFTNNYYQACLIKSVGTNFVNIIIHFVQ